jgi:RNA polymerase sigma-70 factor (ECF subfamily)
MLKNRDDQSFNYLYSNYSGALYTVVLQIIHDQELASDILQEVFINVWRKIDTYDQTKGRLFTWMLNIARNAAIDAIRSKSYQNNKKNQEFPDAYNEDIQGQLTHLNIDGIGLKKMLEKLKTELRILIELAYFKGYTHDEISIMEGIPLGTVKTRIRTALIQLREHIN